MKLSSKLIPRKFCATTLRVEGEDGTMMGIGDAAGTARQLRGRTKVKRVTRSIVSDSQSGVYFGGKT